MDTAVALVEAYLHSGYFAVAGYAVLEALRGEQVRTVTDLGILACRFAGPDTELVRDDGHRPLEPAAMSVDPALECPSDRPKCSLVTSRKVRTAQSAPPKIGCARGSPPTRFGCPANRAPAPTNQLGITQGRAVTPSGNATRETPTMRRAKPRSASMASTVSP